MSLTPNMLPANLVANERLEQAGFSTKNLADFELPQVQHTLAADGTSTPYVTIGDVHEAPVILSVTTPYSTYLEKPHYLLRLLAKHAALGQEAAVVCSQTFEPKSQPFNHAQATSVRRGDFSALAARHLAVMEQVDVRDHQRVVLYAQSMGGDVMAQLAYNNRFDVNRGVLPIAALGVAEPARVSKRPLGAAGMFLAFGRSGGNLSRNILESRSPALLDAWGIPQDASDKQAKKIVTKQVNEEVAKYVRQSIRQNLVVGHGFATPYTLEQLAVLMSAVEYPITAVRSSQSSVFTEKAFLHLQEALPNICGVKNKSAVFEVDDDHSHDDNIRQAARLALYVVSTAV